MKHSPSILKNHFHPPRRRAGRGRMPARAGGGGDRRDTETIHRVTLARGFWMARTEVTQAQWKSVMGNNPATPANKGRNNPVENVSWHDALQFCLEAGHGLQLPTEAQTCPNGARTSSPPIPPATRRIPPAPTPAPNASSAAAPRSATPRIAAPPLATALPPCVNTSPSASAP